MDSRYAWDNSQRGWEHFILFYLNYFKQLPKHLNDENSIMKTLLWENCIILKSSGVVSYLASSTHHINSLVVNISRHLLWVGGTRDNIN